MGYRFRGFFTEWNPDLGEAAVHTWPGCTWRPIYDPFLGIGVRCPDTAQAADGIQYNRLLELTYRIERELPEFVARFHEQVVVFVEADYFGEVCMYAGWVLRVGSLELLVRMADAEPGPRNLERLLAPLSAELPDGRFAPFVRGFWGD